MSVAGAAGVAPPLTGFPGPAGAGAGDDAAGVDDTSGAGDAGREGARSRAGFNQARHRPGLFPPGDRVAVGAGVVAWGNGRDIAGCGRRHW